MVLHIYIGKENLRKDKEYILDNENYFAFSGITLLQKSAEAYVRFIKSLKMG